MKRTDFHFIDADLIFYEALFNTAESDELYQALTDNINWKQEQIKLFGRTYDEPRLTAWYGDAGKSYTYSGKTMHPEIWNDDLIVIKTKIEKIIGLEIEFNSCLLNLYRTGQDSVGWHQDNEKELGINPIIGSVSFGASRNFQLKHIKNKALDKIEIELTHGSLLLMKGTTQHFWKHQIPKTSKTIKPRINLTFRIIK